MNGGNPFSPARILNNLGNHKNEWALKIHLESLYISKQKEFYTFRSLFQNYALINEVQELNTKCFDRWSAKVYIIDKVNGYPLDRKHKGISRVLQGFEVVLLTVLVRACLMHGIFPLSLDHDGLLGASKEELIVQEIEETLSENILQWSEYLLNAKISVVVKK